MPGIIPPFSSASDRGYKFLRRFDAYVLRRGGRIVLWVEGGVAPYAWEVSGTDLTLDEAETAVQYNLIEAVTDAVLDNVETVTVTDAESSEVEIEVCLCDLSDEVGCCDECDTFAWNSFVGGLTVRIGGRQTLRVSGGCPPFKWEVTGSEFDESENYSFEREYTNQRSNLLFVAAGASEADIIHVKVTDACGSVVGNETIADDGAGVVIPTGVVYTEGATVATKCYHGAGSPYTFTFDTDNNPTTYDCTGSCEGESFDIVALGGDYPLFWAIDGEGAWTDAEMSSKYKMSDDSRTLSVYVDDDACGETITITVHDRCTNIPTNADTQEVVVSCIVSGTYVAETSDNCVARLTRPNWADAHDTATGTNLNPLGYGVVGTAYLFSNYSIYRTFLEFDLSALPSGASVSAASLLLTGLLVADADICVQNSEFTTPVGVDDYAEFTGDPLITPVGFSLGLNTLVLNAAGLAVVETAMGGTLKLCLREYTHDYLNSAGAGGLSYFYFAEASGNNRPRLSITYST